MLNKKVNEVFEDQEFDSQALDTEQDTVIDNNIKMLEESYIAQLEKLNSVDGWKVNNTWNPLILSIEAIKTKLDSEKDKERINIVNGYLSDIRQRSLEYFKAFMGIMPESNAFGSIEGLEATELQETLTGLYEFFVLNRRDGITNYIYNMVNDNFKNIVASYKSLVNRQDLGARNERKKARNLDKAVILDKIDDIVKDILKGTITCEDDFVFEITKNFEEEWHNAKVLEDLDGIALPELPNAFFGDILSEEKSDVLRLITMDVYSKLYEKYKET